MKPIITDVVKYFQQHHLAHDLVVLWEDKAYHVRSKELKQGVVVSDYMEYYGDITLQIEGTDLYYNMSQAFHNGFMEVLGKHGYWYDFGYTWSLSLYKEN